MKAITHNTYGTLDALALRDIPTPAVKDGDGLARGCVGNTRRFEIARVPAKVKQGG